MAGDVARLGAESRWISGVALIAGLASVAAIIAGTAVGVPVLEIYFGYIQVIGLIGLPILLIMALVTGLGAALGGSKSSRADFHAWLGKHFGTFDRAAGTLGPILLMPIILGAFGTLKQIMPLIAAFSWDDTFVAIDRLICFGYHPWQITHALFGSPFATAVINLIYTSWLGLLFGAVIGFSLVAPPYLRARFFVSFGAAWLLLGIGAAFLLSSAGPCYAAFIHTSSAAEFAPLMQRLHAIHASHPLGALTWQDELWKAHAERRYGFGMGVSAMPSMHNAIAFLYLLSLGGAKRWVRLATYLFAAAILVGSVHLGWHYLADGLFAWAGMAAIWWGAGAYLRWCGYAPVELAGDETPAPSPKAVEDLPEPLTA